VEGRGGSGDYGAEVVGASLSVIWVHYGCYFAGVVRSFDARSGTHHVVYDDGDEEDIALRAADVVWGGGGGGGGGGKRGGGSGGGGGGGGGGGSGGGGGTAVGMVARQEPTHTSQYRGVIWHLGDRRWQVQFKHNKKQIHVGYFDEEEDAGRAYDRMMVWLQLHGIVINKRGGGVHDSSNIKASLNFAYDEYKGEFDELRRMTQDELVQKLRQEGWRGQAQAQAQAAQVSGGHAPGTGRGRGRAAEGWGWRWWAGRGRGQGRGRGRRRWLGRQGRRL